MITRRAGAMLCKFCESLDLDKATREEVDSADLDNPDIADGAEGAVHHDTYTDLLLSAENGCDLCTRICEHERAQNRRLSSMSMQLSNKQIRCYYDPGISCLTRKHPKTIQGCRIADMHVYTISSQEAKTCKFYLCIIISKIFPESE